MITALAIMIAIAGYLQFAGTNLEKEYLAADDADTLSAVDSTDIVTDMESLDSDMDIVMEDYLEEDMQVAEATPEEGEIPGEAVLTGTSGVEVLSAARLSKEQTRARNKETLLEIINSTELSDAGGGGQHGAHDGYCGKRSGSRSASAGKRISGSRGQH